NAATGEPFLRLPAPHANIIITPPRMSDVEPSVPIMNDPAVYMWLGPRAPIGYNAAKAESWLTQITAESDVLLDELRTNPRGPFSGCLVRHVREVRAEGTDVFLGDVGLGLSNWTEVQDKEEQARLVAENNAQCAGDPDIAWHIGYYIAPSHQSRGLATAAVKALIEWGIVWMGARCIRSGTFEGNHGSLKVLQKNGFVLVDTL
ncbi:acyl-CoA N-acyltransferase, partial [Mycena maculata]